MNALGRFAKAHEEAMERLVLLYALVRWTAFPDHLEGRLRGRRATAVADQLHGFAYAARRTIELGQVVGCLHPDVGSERYIDGVERAVNGPPVAQSALPASTLDYSLNWVLGRIIHSTHLSISLLPTISPDAQAAGTETASVFEVASDLDEMVRHAIFTESFLQAYLELGTQVDRWIESGAARTDL